MSSLLIVGVDAKVFLIASADPCQADIITALLIVDAPRHPSTGFLLFFGFSIRRSPSHQNFMKDFWFPIF
jgi:hypothetical protein